MSETRSVSIIIPCRGRPDQAVAAVKNAFETTEGYTVQVVVVVDDDPETLEALQSYVRHTPNGHTSPRVPYIVSNDKRLYPVACWNLGSLMATGDILCMGQTDTRFHPGWLEAAFAALDTLPEHTGVVGFRDGSGRLADDFQTTWMMTRDYAIRYQGGVFAPPWYRHYFFDPEVCFKAMENGHYVYAPDAFAEHFHPSHHPAAIPDETYSESFAHSFHRDERVFDWRRRRDYPIDYTPLLVPPPKPKIYWTILDDKLMTSPAVDAGREVEYFNAKQGYTHLVLPQARTDIARNMAFEEFCKLSRNVNDLLVMLDEDHEHPRDVVKQLAEANFIGVLVAKARVRAYPFNIAAYRRDLTKPDKPLIPIREVDVIKETIARVDCVGTGAVCIPRWVIDHFFHEDCFPPYFRYHYMDLVAEYPSEDIYFSAECEQLGVAMGVLMTCYTPHLTFGFIDDGDLILEKGVEPVKTS